VVTDDKFAHTGSGNLAGADMGAEDATGKSNLEAGAITNHMKIVATL